MQPHYRTGAIWGLLGLMLGAIVSGAVVSTFARPSTSTSPELSRNAAPVVVGDQEVITHHRIVLSLVSTDEIFDAVETMRKLPEEQKSIRADLEKHKYRLLWLTAWDWNMQGEVGDTIAITSDSFRRVLRLSHHQRRIAIPEPRSGYIEVEGLQAEGGIISISLLSGTQPIALPRMSVGDIAKIEIRVAEQPSSRNAENEMKKAWQTEAGR